MNCDCDYPREAKCPVHIACRLKVERIADQQMVSLLRMYARSVRGLAA